MIKGNIYDEKADVFSFGVVLYELFSGNLPNDGFLPLKYAEMVANGYRPKITMICDPWQSLISCCWDQKPEKRPSFTQVFELINKIEPYLDKVDCKEEESSQSGSVSGVITEIELPENFEEEFGTDGYQK